MEVGCGNDFQSYMRRLNFEQCRMGFLYGSVDEKNEVPRPPLGVMHGWMWWSGWLAGSLSTSLSLFLCKDLVLEAAVSLKACSLSFPTPTN
jgi:hypothetical protein